MNTPLLLEAEKIKGYGKKNQRYKGEEKKSKVIGARSLSTQKHSNVRAKEV